MSLICLRLPFVMTAGAIVASVAGLRPSSAEPVEQLAANLPAPYATPSAMKVPEVIGWPDGKAPQAPDGLKVTALVRDLENPRWLYALPNADVLVAQSRTLHKPPKPEEEAAKPPQKKAEDKVKDDGMKKT